jgi:hypothetical protein
VPRIAAPAVSGTRGARTQAPACGIYNWLVRASIPQMGYTAHATSVAALGLGKCNFVVGSEEARCTTPHRLVAHENSISDGRRLWASAGSPCACAGGCIWSGRRSDGPLFESKPRVVAGGGEAEHSQCDGQWDALPGSYDGAKDGGLGFAGRYPLGVQAEAKQPDQNEQ